MTLIQDVTTREILNELGEPTLEADIVLACGALGRASLPSGVKNEMRDQDDPRRYFGRGVQRALEQVRDRVSLVVRGLDALDQVGVDRELGTLERLSGNARLVVSMATAQAAAIALEIPLHRHLGGLCLHPFPMPLVSVQHVAGLPETSPFADLMLAPTRRAWHFRDALRACAEVTRLLATLPPHETPQDALDDLRHAIESCGYNPETDLTLAADIRPGTTAEQLAPLLEQNVFSFVLADHSQCLPQRDDVTQVNTGQPDAHDQACTLALRNFTNVTDCLEAAVQAQRHGTAIILDVDAPGTEDTFEADLAIAAGASFVRTGPLASLHAVTRCNHLARLA